MVSLKSFIQAIHDAILNASDALMEKNMDLLNQYFEEEEDGAVKEKMNEAIVAAEKVTNPKVKVTRKSLTDALDSIRSLKDSLNAHEASNQDLDSKQLYPKTVTLNYPTVNDEGDLEHKEVHVPLLTLVPIQFSQVSELKLTADLQLTLVDDQLQVSLGKHRPAKNSSAKGIEEDGTSKNNIGNIEIVIKPQEVSDGMQHVIDAYEKILKAQLPL